MTAHQRQQSTVPGARGIDFPPTGYEMKVDNADPAAVEIGRPRQATCFDEASARQKWVYLVVLRLRDRWHLRRRAT